MNLDEVSCNGNGTAKKYIKENELLRLLPNFDESEQYADSLLSEIKANFNQSLVEKQFYDNFNENLKLLRRYVKFFNLRFTKDDYVSIIELLYGVLIQKDIDVVVTLNVITELKTFLKNLRCLSRTSLTIQWLPLYNIWYYHTHSSNAKNGIICSPKSIKDSMVEVIRMFSNFFPLESTEEIWLLARPYLHCPYPLIPGKHNGLKILKLFLPFYYNNKQPFFDFIWPHLLPMMSIATWTSKCEHDLMILLGRAASTYVGLIDWTPHLDQIFTALLRSLKIKVSGFSKRTKYNNTKVYVDIIVYAIHGSDNCEPICKLRQLFQAIDHLYHPSSHSHHTSKLLNLMYQISAGLLTRYRNERVKKPNHHSLGSYPKEFHITDAHIKNIVNIMLPSCEFAIFTKGKADFGAVLSSIQKLSCLCPEIMVPACLKLFHETSETVLEPHRALSTLAVVSMLHVPLLNSVERYPEGKLAVFPLMRQLLTYININDPPKSYISIICFGNLANILWMEDFSECAGDQHLTPFEKEVALATAQFEDLVLQFFDKLFEIIDIGFSESEMVESQRNSDFRTEMLIDSLVMVIPNISNAISQQVLDKTIDFAFSHSFLSEPIQQFFAAIFGCLLEREEIAESGYNRFMSRYMRYFHGLIRDDCFLIHEKLDFKFVWLSNLLIGFIKTKSLSFMTDNLMEVLLALNGIGSVQSSRIMDLLLMYSINHCSHATATLGIISDVRDKQYHLNSWSGLITRAQLRSDSRYRMPYTQPGPSEQRFLMRIMSEIISPTLDRLKRITDIIRNDRNEEKIENKELRSVCSILLTVGECSSEYLISKDTVAPVYAFDASHGPLPLLHISPSASRIHDVNIISANNSTQSIIDDIKIAARDALSVFYAAITSTDSLSRLKIPLSDVEDLFHLLYRCHDIRSGAVFYGSNKSFLDRRFEAFTHPLRRMSNTMLNWVMTIDDWNSRRFKVPAEPLTIEIASLADSLFLFIGLPHSSLQRFSNQCLFNLLSGYNQLDEYLIHKCLLIVTDKTAKIDEHLHAGMSQLLVKIFEKKVSFESITFVYKFISIFVALSRSPHVDVRNNRNLHSKMFDLLVQLMGSFVISLPDLTFDFKVIADSLGRNNAIANTHMTNTEIVESRRQLYQSCIDYCFSSYLDCSTRPNDDAPLFAKTNLSCSLLSTTTWQSIYQMSIILPLHIELPIPLKFLELFFLIIFSPSKELSSQGCNQINIVVWLLKQNIEKVFRTPNESGLEDVPPSQSLTPGPRSDNRFLVIEKDTDFWELPEKAKISDGSNGYLWWPQRMKVRRYHELDGQCPSLSGSNAQCWELLCRVFESEDFCTHLESFLLDLGSQFLREEETCQASSSILNTLHQFSVDHLINSMFTCLGPSKGLPLIRKLYERLVKCSDSNQVYANRMAVQVLSGIAVSTKHWTSEECKLFFTTDILSYIDLYLEHCCKSEVKLISKSLIDLCVNTLVDCRQLLPVYRHFIHLLDHLEHDSTKEAVCLYFVRCFAKNCGWRVGGSIVDDMCDLWRKFVSSPIEKLRKEAGKIMKLLLILPLLTNQYLFCTEEQRAAYQRIPGELIQMFASQTQLVLSKKGLEPSVVTIKALRVASPLATDMDISSEDESVDSSMITTSETPPTPMESPPNEPENNSESGDIETAPDKTVSTMISCLTTTFMDMDEFISKDILKMFFICFDLIPVRDKMHIYSHLRHCAVMVANIFLSHDPVVDGSHERLTCSTLFSFIESATKHKSWRVRLIAVKMLQIISFNNFFVVSRPGNISRLTNIAFSLITDDQIEVRKECGVMLSGLIQCSMYVVTGTYVSNMCARIKPQASVGTRRLSPAEMVRMHSGILGLCAFIQAHPYDIPEDLPEVLTVLCRHINKPEPISGTVKETLSRFKKSHQDSWHLQRVHFTEDQLCALTDVLVSPSYYA